MNFRGTFSPEDFSDEINNIDPAKRYYTFKDLDKNDFQYTRSRTLTALYITIVIMFVLFMAWAAMGCKKESGPQQTTKQVKVVLSIKWGANDSICYHSILPAINNYVASPIVSQAISFTLTGTGQNKDSFSAFEVGSATNTDSLQMHIYVNGVLTYSQAAIGSVEQQIQY